MVKWLFQNKGERTMLHTLPQFFHVVEQIVTEKPTNLDLDRWRVLLTGLELALIESDKMHEYLAFLRTFAEYVSPTGCSLQSDRLDSIHSSSLECLRIDELLAMSVNYLDLLILRDRLQDDEPSEHWLALMYKYEKTC
jgi:hypothetical protein